MRTRPTRAMHLGQGSAGDGPTDRWVPWVVAAVAAALYSVFAVTQWRLLEVPSWDLGIFTQLAKAYSRLDAPVVTIKGEGFNLLGDHFHPLLVLLAPFYRLFPSGLTLLVVQAVLLAVSAVPITRVARDLLGRGRGTALGVAYALGWGLQGAVAAQFHEIAFAVPLLAFALAAFLRGRWWACAAWAAPLVFVKEDLGLTVAALGLVLLWRGRRRAPGQAEDAEPRGTSTEGRAAGADLQVANAELQARGAERQVANAERQAARAERQGPSAERQGPSAERRAPDTGRQFRAGAFLAAWGTVWFVLAIWVILPALNPGGTWDYYDRVGSEEQQGLLDVLLGALVPGEKYVTVLLLVAAAGVVGVRSPLVWLWVPTLAWRFVGNVEFYWGWTWHYSAILMPIAAAALLDAVTPPPDPGTARRPAGPGGWATIGVGVAVATTALMMPTLPLARLVEPATYAVSDRHDGATAAIDAVAPGSTVEADIYLMAYLVPRAQVYWVGNAGNPAPDFVLLDTLRRTWPDRDITDAAAFAESRHGVDYELVLDSDGYQVARRVGTAS